MEPRKQLEMPAAQPHPRSALAENWNTLPAACRGVCGLGLDGVKGKPGYSEGLQ